MPLIQIFSRARLTLFSTTLLFLLPGCSSSPSTTTMKGDAKTVVFVQNGVTPLSFSTGVIDTASFWGKYGNDVGMNTGGWLWPILAENGKASSASQMSSNAKIVADLYGNNKMADSIVSRIMPSLAEAWHVPYKATDVIKLSSKIAYVDPETHYLTNVNTDADLVLMAELRNINLTEGFSFGGAVMSGVTLGMNEKSLTIEAHMVLSAYKPDSEWAAYKKVWSVACGNIYSTMKTAYPLKELKQSPEKMNQVLSEAADQALESCNRLLTSISKQS